MRTTVKLFPLLAALVLSSPAPADTFAYVVSTNPQTGAGTFGTVDLNNGAFNPIGSTLTTSSAGLVPGGPGGQFYTLGADGNLYTINPTTGAETLIGPTSSTTLIALSLAGLNGVLYATDYSNNIYTVNPVTGAATLLAATGIPPDHGVPFTTDPANGDIYLCDETLYGLNGSLYATYDEFETDGTTISVLNSPNLWKINPTTGLATEIDPTGFMLGGSVYTSGSLYAFQAIAAPPNSVFDPALQLDTINLTNGNTTFVTNVDPSAGLIFAAAPDVPEPASIFLLGTGLAALATRVRTTCKRQC